MAFLARCPDCGQFQVCVFDLDTKVNLKCRKCGKVFPSIEETPAATPEAVNWSLAMTLCDYEFEPPRVATANLVIVQDLPSIYPRRKRSRRRLKKRKRLRVPVPAGPIEFEPPATGEVIPNEPELPEVPEPAALPTEEGAHEETVPHLGEEPVAIPPDVVSTSPSPALLRPRAVSRPKRKPKAEDEEVEYGRLQLNGLSIVALFLLVGGLFSASVEFLGRAFWPLMGLSLLTGVLAIRTSLRQGRRLVIPGTVTGVATITIVGALIAPKLLGPDRPGETAPEWANAVLVVPHPQFAGDPSVRAAEWVDASKASIQQGLARVEISDIRIGKIRHIGEDDHLLIRVRVHRTPGLPGASESERGWDGKVPAVLRDAAGTPYQQIATTAESGTQSGKDFGPVPVETTLVFPAAAGTRDGLKLEIPAGAWGGNANLKFALPRWMIKR